MKEKYFLTTPLYYVNAEPHIGSAYTTMAADTICRFWSLTGKDVLLLTGVDEHGGKIEATAQDRNVAPQAHCDEISAKFEELWQKLGINYQAFSRTSSPKHKVVVQQFFELVRANGDIYQADYTGLYCLACEDFKNERELLEGQLCPIHHTKVQTYSEKNYFFKLSKYTETLKNFFSQNPNFIQPKFRQNEVKTWLDEGLKDFPISRTSVKWGIPVPGDDEQTIYVWFDALLGYLSAILPDEVVLAKDFDLKKELTNLSHWPANTHLIGKDILRFHAVYWIAMLMSAEFPLPKELFGHGFLTKDGEKMGKTRGNIIVPAELINKYGADAVRFYFLFTIPFGQDGDFTEKSFVENINAYLANRIGNLFSRALKLIENNGDGKLPAAKLPDSSRIKQEGLQLLAKVTLAMQSYDLQLALTQIFDYVDLLNLNFTELKPWTLLKSEASEEHELAKTCLLETFEGLRIVSALLEPFIPKLAKTMQSTFASNCDFSFESLKTWPSLKTQEFLYNPGIIFVRQVL